MVITILRIRSTNSIIGGRMGEVVKFPNSRQRVGKKYRQEELQGLTAEYEILLKRLTDLIEVDSDD